MGRETRSDLISHSFLDMDRVSPQMSTQMSRAPKSPEGHQIYLEQPTEHRGLDYRSQMASSSLLCLHTLVSI